MSKVTVTMCDGCRKEITNKPFEPNLALIVTMPSTKITAHYCYECATSIIDTINNLMQQKKWESEK